MQWVLEPLETVLARHPKLDFAGKSSLFGSAALRPVYPATVEAERNPAADIFYEIDFKRETDREITGGELMKIEEYGGMKEGGLKGSKRRDKAVMLLLVSLIN